MTLISRFVLAFVLVASGVVCWSAAGTAGRLAARHERIATLHDAGPATGQRWQAWMERLLESAAGELTGVAADTSSGAGLASSQHADYWQARYDTLTPDRAGDTDAALLLMSANALFRRAERGSDAATRVERLDQVLQAYASALKNGGFSRDAAFNYEYVARLRDSMARAKPGASPRPASPQPAGRSDLPSGPTIHGRPGTHPPTTKGEEFEVLTPMDYGEREAQPEPTPGRPLPRKG